MTHEKPKYPVTFQFSASLDDLERLVRCIDKTSITELVKHDKHLQQHVFHGFRPTHLPWDRVPNAVARHAQECSGTMDYLLKVWHTTNSSLKKQVKEEVHIDTIEDDIAKILANLDHDKEKRDRLLWALLLDDRGEIQAALTSGLRDALMNDSSTLMIKADRYKLATELEKARQEINSVKNERDNLKEQNQKIATLQNEIATLTDAKAQMEAQFQEELTQRDAAFQETKRELDTAQKERDTVYQEKDTLQAALEQEQCRNRELQKIVHDLKAGLDAVIASHKENIPQIQPAFSQFDEAWEKAVHFLSSYLSSGLYIKCSVDNSIQSSERWNDWQSWQQIESTLVQPLLAMSTHTRYSLDNAEQVQKLLVLRWYLLEWVKLSIREMLLTEDSITDQVELGGED